LAWSETLEAHQERVLEERTQLNDRLLKLDSFLYTEKFNCLSMDDQDLLVQQQRIMTEYLDVLDQRIANF
jgi:hypothetical protein